MGTTNRPPHDPDLGHLGNDLVASVLGSGR